MFAGVGRPTLRHAKYLDIDQLAGRLRGRSGSGSGNVRNAFVQRVRAAGFERFSIGPDGRQRQPVGNMGRFQGQQEGQDSGVQARVGDGRPSRGVRKRFRVFQVEPAGHHSESDHRGEGILHFHVP